MPGPREQFRPTTSAPAASSCAGTLSGALDPSRIRPSPGSARVITAGLPELLDRLESQERLPASSV